MFPVCVELNQQVPVPGPVAGGECPYVRLAYEQRGSQGVRRMSEPAAGGSSGGAGSLVGPMTRAWGWKPRPAGFNASPSLWHSRPFVGASDATGRSRLNAPFSLRGRRPFSPTARLEVVGIRSSSSARRRSRPARSSRWRPSAGRMPAGARSLHLRPRPSTTDPLAWARLYSAMNPCRDTGMEALGVSERHLGQDPLHGRHLLP